MKTLAFATLALALSFSSNSFAKDKTVSSLLCYVHANGSFNGQVIWGDEFFRRAVNYSNRNNTCVIAKIYGGQSSSRIYLNGRRLLGSVGGMTTGETKEILRSAYINPNSCTVFSCEESAI